MTGFNERMTTDVQAPQPRWLYLLMKLVTTVAIGNFIHDLFRVDILNAAWIAVFVYVAIGIFLWYRNGIKRWFGTGSFFGDILYHLLPSLPAVFWLAPSALPIERVGFTLVIGLIWWQFDLAGYGPMRSKPE